MKKHIIACTTLLTLWLPLISTAAPTCPEPDTIHQYGIFKYAKGPVIWTLTSLPFKYHGRKWVIAYRTAEMTRVREENQAIRQGQDLFNHSQLLAPLSEMDGNQLTCFYTDRYQGDYWVSAYTLK